ncbi:MAG: UDP-N-acetylmuramate--L-alanine ligase [Acidimicrobiia bacterium]
MSRELDLGAVRRVHVVGIGGAGMSAIASVLARMGHRVSGSDLKESRGLDRLRLLGVDARTPHDAGHVPPDVDVVVVSTAIPDRNPEVQLARARGVPVLRRCDALRAIVATRRAIAVAGSHGKTTTSSMLAVVLRAAGWHPSFLIGGELNEVGTNASYDDGDWLVVEADESDGTFLELPAEAGIVTNVEPDHLEHYGEFDALVAAFRRFVDGLAGPRVLCVDDAVARELARDVSDCVTYGAAPGAAYRLVAYTGHRAGSGFDVEHGGSVVGRVELPLAGRHNALNALGAAAMACELGVPFEDVRRGLSTFGGVARRFQFRGERDGVTFVDDYAHLPGEVAAAIAAAREGEWQRVVAVFQPHRYTRTARLWREFADSFTGADAVVLTDVYSAGETPRPGVSGQLILRAVLDAHPSQPVVYLPHRADLERHIPRLARPGDVVVTLGAGDLTSLPDVWLDDARREPV